MQIAKNKIKTNKQSIITKQLKHKIKKTFILLSINKKKRKKRFFIKNKLIHYLVTTVLKICTKQVLKKIINK